MPNIPTASNYLSTFPLSDVALLESPFLAAMERNAEVLLKLDPDRFLHNTRLYAGMEPKGAIYGGWESRGVAGHSLGHYLTALSLQYAATGDQRFRDRIDYIVSEMAECQEAYGDGYVGALPPLELATLRGLRMGKVETNGGFGFQGGAWVPWYTQHKILAGIKDAWLLAGCPQAKEVTLRLADWVDEITRHLTPEQVQEMLSVEHGGMNETLADLYAQTGEVRYREVSHRFYHKAVLDPLLAGRDELPGKHANTQVPKVIGVARDYEVTGDAGGRTITENFWNFVVNRYTFAMGGNSDREHFFPAHEANKHLSPESAETCNTYNMLRLTEHLFSWDPQVRYTDFYERALYNHILASQDPQRGMYTYFFSLKPGHFRTYSTLEDSFWCCFGTGLENHTKYGEAIYFHSAADLYVNLFIPSSVNWKEKGFVLEQRTAYPKDGVVEFTVQEAPETPITLQVRCPGWAAAVPTFTLNGAPLDVNAAPGSYAAISRVWQKGDHLQVVIPFALRTEPLNGDPTKLAFLYGPLVLAGDFGPAPDPYAADHTKNERLPVADVPALVTEHPELLTTRNLQKSAGDELTWTTVGLGADSVTLRPLLDLPFNYTAVYWDVLTPAENARRTAERKATEEAARRDAERTVDSFHPGEQQSETDHGFASERSFAGGHAGQFWRDARDGGWFEFRMKVLPNARLVLRLTYWGDDAGRTFDVLIDGERLVTQTLNRNHPGQTFNVDIPLPAHLVAGKGTIIVRFQAPPSGTAGGLFGAAILREER